MGGFPGQQTKRKTITEALKIYSVHFFWEPFLLHLSLSLSHCALLWPDPSLILHFTSIPDDFTVVTER